MCSSFVMIEHRKYILQAEMIIAGFHTHMHIKNVINVSFSLQWTLMNLLNVTFYYMKA